MEWLLFAVLALLVLLVLDSTAGRWALIFVSNTVRITDQKGGTPESGKLLVYLPGILFDGDESVAEIKDAMLKPVARGLFVSYGFWRFLPKKVIARAAQEIGYAREERFTSVVLVGASFGGRVAAELALELQTLYGWSSSDLTVVMVDTPCENNSFQRPGLTVSLILKWVFAGPLLSALLAPIIKRGLVPPYDVDIEPGLNFGEVKRRAVERMARFRLSSTSDQQRYLADNAIQWTMGLTGIEVVYLWCDYHNITVVQPAAMRKVELYTHQRVSRFTWRVVPSPHCAFGQMPTLWRGVFAEVLAGRARAS